MSHHPSSAELAAFRRSIAYNRDGQAHATALAFGYVPRAIGVKAPGQWHAPTLSHDGTRPEELQRGIGSRGYLAGASASFDRREASASRSRAYAHGFGSLADRETFAPSPWAAPFLDIPGDAGCDCGTGDAGHILASDTWSDEDAPRSSLPIRYQPSFVITR